MLFWELKLASYLINPLQWKDLQVISLQSHNCLIDSHSYGIGLIAFYYPLWDQIQRSECDDGTLVSPYVLDFEKSDLQNELAKHPVMACSIDGIAKYLVESVCGRELDIEVKYL